LNGYVKSILNILTPRLDVITNNNLDKMNLFKGRVLNLLKYIFFVTLFFFAVSCATTAKYEKLLDSWMGANVNELIRSWGAPNSSYEMSNGNKILTYMRSRSGSIPIYNQPQSTTHQGTIYGSGGMTNYSGTSTSTYGTTTYIPVTWSCKTEFTVNAQETIINWRWQGNNCISTYEGK